MEVLKVGKETLNMTVTCPNCKSVLRLEARDIQACLGEIYAYRCPCCNLSNKLHKISEPMKSAAKQNPLNLNVDIKEIGKSLGWIK